MVIEYTGTHDGLIFKILGLILFTPDIAFCTNKDNFDLSNFLGFPIRDQDFPHCFSIDTVECYLKAYKMKEYQ